MYVKVIKTNRNVLLYLLAAGASNLGNVISGLAFLFLAYELTESSIYTTGIAFSQVVPYLFFGLIGGVIADWVNKKRLLIAIELIRGPLMVSLVIFDQLGMLTYWHLIVISSMIHCLGCFFNPAHRAMLPMITKEEERTAVNSLLDTFTRGVTVLGPIVSAGFINTIGIIHFFTFDALTHLLSSLFIYHIQFSETQTNAKPKKMKDILISIQKFTIWAKNQYTIRTLFMVTVIIVFLNTWVWQVGLFMQLSNTTPDGEEWYSILLGWYGAAVIAVNVMIPLLWKKLSLKIYLFGSLMWGGGIFLLGFAYHLPFYFIGVLAAAIGLPISGLSRVYLLQRYLPADQLGLGFSFNAFLLYFSNVLSLGIFGFISSLLSTHILFLGCGMVMILGSGVYLRAIVRKDRGVMPYNRLNS